MLLWRRQSLNIDESYSSTPLFKKNSIKMTERIEVGETCETCKRGNTGAAKVSGIKTEQSTL